jgi:hypothetical protein
LVNTDLNDTNALVRLPDNGDLSPGLGSSALDQFSITAKHIYLAVNSVDTKTWTAKVTITSSPIKTALSYSGPLMATVGQKVTPPRASHRQSLGSAGAKRARLALDRRRSLHGNN